MMRRRTHTRKGFNLIESAIVLAVVGFVIGGIWVAAVSVNNQMKANRTIAGIIQIASGVQAIYKGFAWGVPVSSNTNFTSAAIKANLVPQDWVKSGELTSPYGGMAFILRSEWAGDKIAVYFHGTGSHPSGVTPSQCNRIIMSAANRMKDQTNFIFVQVLSASAPQYYTPPINTSTVNCPSDITMLNFWFRRS